MPPPRRESEVARSWDAWSPMERARFCVYHLATHDYLSGGDQASILREIDRRLALDAKFGERKKGAKP